MATLFSREGPDRVPGDIVAPLRYWDDTIVMKSLIVYCMMRYDVALDAKKLNGSLERLLSLKGWRKLGARLRKNAKGEVEYHLPAEYNASRPAVSFSELSHDISITEDPLASRLPKANSTRPAVVGDPEEFTDLCRCQGMPTKIEDYFTQDRGQLGLHVVKFRDATLVVLYYNHTSFDLLGWGALMTAWTHVLHGSEHLVAMPYGGDPGSEEFDAMSTLGTNPTKPHVLAAKSLGIGGLIGYGLRNIYDLAIKGKENRLVCVPGLFIEKLHADALAELRTAASPGEKPFLSEGDVLAAWWVRLLITQLEDTSSRRTINIQYAASARKAVGLSSDLAKDPYVSNLFTVLYNLLPAADIINKPLSHLAQQIRQSIAEQGARDQVEAYFALQRQLPGKMLPVFGDSGMHMVTLSNWGKANMYGHDFSPAAIFENDRSTEQYPSYIQSTQLPFNFPEGFCIIGKDQQRNWWLYGFRTAGQWAKIEKALADLGLQ
ncbi:hypothetical protein BX600DRAFT_481192 [Xylariales sp. PMI_506]|nr:hypothetical protein BX600DRAFT_481192 [Xylariales sp. PMI_506]